MKKKVTKELWYGSEIDKDGNPVYPPLAPSEARHLEGLITLGKGFVSEGFSAANGGLVVRGGELIEEVEDSLIEELE